MQKLLAQSLEKAVQYRSLGPARIQEEAAREALENPASETHADFLQCADSHSGLADNGKQLTNLLMSEEQLKAFLEAVKADAGLQEKLKAATDVDAVVAIAKAAAFVISADELKKAQTEVSEEELEHVAGGNITVDLRDTGLEFCGGRLKH